MPTATHTTVLDQPIGTVWAMLRDFNNYPAYIDGITASVIEDGRAIDEVGAVRRFTYGGTELRQRLIAHSDITHHMAYAGFDPFAPPPEAGGGLSPARYEGTITLRRITDRDRTLLDWSVTVDVAPDQAEAWRGILTPLIADWSGSLRRSLDRAAAPAG